MNYVVAALAIALALLGWAYKKERDDHTAVVKAFAQFQAGVDTEGRAAKAAADATEARWRDKIQEVTRDADEQQKAAVAAADNLRGASASLRIQLAAARARSCPGAANPPVAGASAPAEASVDLSTDVQRRVDEAVQRVGEFADAAYRAGAACERSYDAVIGAGGR